MFQKAELKPTFCCFAKSMVGLEPLSYSTFLCQWVGWWSLEQKFRDHFPKMDAQKQIAFWNIEEKL